MEWKRTFRGNDILRISDNAFVSYNENPSALGLSSDDDQPETALVCEKDGQNTYFILNGDHRLAYEEAIKKDGFGGALAYFRKMRATCESTWSMK